MLYSYSKHGPYEVQPQGPDTLKFSICLGVPLLLVITKFQMEDKTMIPVLSLFQQSEPAYEVTAQSCSWGNQLLNRHSFFSVRMEKRWNSLPTYLVRAPPVQMLKRQQDSA